MPNEGFSNTAAMPFDAHDFPNDGLIHLLRPSSTSKAGITIYSHGQLPQAATKITYDELRLPAEVGKRLPKSMKLRTGAM